MTCAPLAAVSIRTVCAGSGTGDGAGVTSDSDGVYTGYGVGLGSHFGRACITVIVAG